MMKSFAIIALSGFLAGASARRGNIYKSVSQTEEQRVYKIMEKFQSDANLNP